MLSIGYNLTQKDDKLQTISIAALFKLISEPTNDIVELIGHLRLINNLDPQRYRKQKTRLPYVVPSLFTPPIRRTEYFASSQYFILDFDHFYENNQNIAQIKETLSKDDRVALIYESPSGNGLKVFFVLKQKIYDPYKYKIIYSEFANQFAQSHNIVNLLDSKTCDVTRACFLSCDTKTHFNANAVEIDIENIVNFDNYLEVKQIQKEIDKVDNVQKIEPQPLAEDVFAEIKKIFNPNLPQKVQKTKNIYVPPQLDKIIATLIDVLKKHLLNVENIININYGKKIIVSYQQHQAEVNVFYGRRGFSVVKSPKNGTNKELMELTYGILLKFFDEYNQLNYTQLNGNNDLNTALDKT